MWLPASGPCAPGLLSVSGEYCVMDISDIFWGCLSVTIYQLSVLCVLWEGEPEETMEHGEWQEWSPCLSGSMAFWSSSFHNHLPLFSFFFFCFGMMYLAVTLGLCEQFLIINTVVRNGSALELLTTFFFILFFIFEELLFCLATEYLVFGLLCGT